MDLLNDKNYSDLNEIKEEGYKTKSFSDLLFCYLPFLLLGLNYIFINSLDIHEYKSIFRFIAIGLLMIVCFIDIRRKNLSLNAFFFICICGLQIWVNGLLAVNLIVLVFFSINSYFSYSKQVHSLYLVEYILMGTMAVLLLFGVVQNVTYVSTLGRLRSTIGFLNPNSGAMFLASFLFIYSLEKQKITNRFALFLCIAIGLIYRLTDNRTFLLSILTYALLLHLFLIREKKGWKLNLGKICVIMVDVFFILNLISVFFLDKLMFLDELTSYRISLYQEMVNNAGLRGFLLGGTEDAVDSFYYMFLFSYGVLTYLFLFISVHFAMKELIKKKQFRKLAFLTAVFEAGIMESTIYRPEVLYVLIAWRLIFANSNHLWRRKDEDKSQLVVE